MSSFFGSTTAADLFGTDVTELAESMYNTAVTAATGADAPNSGEKEISEEDLFKTSLGYFLFPSDPLSLVCETLKENKATEISTETFVLEPNPCKVFAKELKENTSVTTLKLLSESAEEVLNDESCMVLAKGLDYRRNMKQIMLTLYPETDLGKHEFMRTLQFQTKLESLTILSSFLDPDIAPRTAQAFQKFMEESKMLKELTILCLGETPPEFSGLAKAVMTCASLEKLSLKSYRQNEWGEDPGSLQALLDAVAMSLESFEIYNLFIGEKGIKSLKAVFDQSITSKLVLRNCHLSTRIKQLEPSLRGNTSLTELDLGGGRAAHGIGDHGAMVLANLLKGNNEMPLASLTLQHAGITDNGAVFLGNALKMNTVLTRLDLRNNEIEEAGLVAFGNALTDNSTLVELLLLETVESPPVTGLQGLAEGLAKNMTMKSLRESDFPKCKKKAVKRELERLDLLIKFNNEANYEAKSTFCSEYSTNPTTTSDDPNTIDFTAEKAKSTISTESKCKMCNRMVKGEVLHCKSVFEPHCICIGCMEMHLSNNLGKKQIECPVVGCTNSQPFSVSEDLYGKVSAFYYEMHCKQMFASAATDEPEEEKEEMPAPAPVPAPTLETPPLQQAPKNPAPKPPAEEVDISDLLDD